MSRPDQNALDRLPNPAYWCAVWYGIALSGAMYGGMLFVFHPIAIAIGGVAAGAVGAPVVVAAACLARLCGRPKAWPLATLAGAVTGSLCAVFQIEGTPPQVYSVALLGAAGASLVAWIYRRPKTGGVTLAFDCLIGVVFLAILVFAWRVRWMA